MSLNFNIELKQDDPQRVIELNGVPTRFYATAEEFNLLVMVINHLLGKESALYKGEFDFIEELEEKHPLPEPGSYAHLRVVDGDDIFCRWDNTNKKWIQDGLVKDQPEVNIGVAENIRAVLEATGTKYYGTKDGVAGVWPFPQGTGGSPETFSGFKINSFSNGYQGGLEWRPFANFEFEGNPFSSAALLTPTTADIPAGEKKFAAIVLNSNGSITLAQGDPAVNPSAPNIDVATQIIPDGGLILLSSGAATPEGVSLQKIYTNNSGIAGGECDTSASFGAARWDFNFNDGEDGVCIKGTQLQANDRIEFTPENAIPIANFTELTFKIKNLVNTGLPAGSSGGFRFLLTGSVLVNGNVQTTTILLPQFQNSGYEVTNTTSWQYISHKLPATSLIDVTGISFIFDHGDPTVVPTILLDDIKYNDGSAPSGENYATVGYVDRLIAELKKYAEDQDATTLQAAKAYADSLDIGGTADHLHDSYDTIPLMISGQAGQIDGEYYLVVDASDDPTVGAGWALYEYLGTTLGTLEDYRKLSEEESLDVLYYDYAQDIADVQAEVDALEVRVTNLEAASGASSNISAGAFTGELNVSGGNRYYDDYVSGAVVNLSLSETKVLGATATVRIKGDLTGTIPPDWNFSGQPVNSNSSKYNELSLLYVKPGDIRIVNRVVAYVDATAPSAPTNVQITNIADSSATVAWNASTDI
ncbi:hypothetical protein VS868_12050 [Salinimicrobium sp. 3283s]|uniref:hypothetical protein n=1 Tax=Salinimicrobium sp. 3283s TaxID=3114359 RepID=UPI0031F033ED